MISFIILETNDYERDLYIKVIKKFLYTSLDYYNIYEFKQYDNKMIERLNEIKGRKVYIIDITFKGIDGLELARKIRLDDDYDSQIIITYPPSYKIKPSNIKYALVLNYIKQDSKEIKELYLSVCEAYRIITKDSVLIFSSFDEIRRLPYDDIYYIEKESNNNYVTIYTKDDSYIKYSTIKEMNEMLNNDTRFLMCGRSLIINLYKVDGYDCKYNTLYFRNGKVYENISSRYKSIIKSRLRKEKINNKLKY